MSAFVLLMLYSVIPAGFKPWTVSDITYVFHTVDFRLGFCTHMLPGALYGLFFPERSPETATLFESILLVLLFLMTAYLCEKLLLSVDTASRASVAAVLFFFLTGPCTFSIFVNRLGMIDFYWIFFSAAILILLEKKRLVLAVIPLFFLIVLTHYASVMNYVPWLWMIMLYKILCTENKKERKTLAVILTLSVIVAGLSLLYFVMNNRNNLVYSQEEFDRIILSRGAVDAFYYDTALYRDRSVILQETQMPVIDIGDSVISWAFASVLQQIIYNLRIIEPYVLVPPLILILPCLVVLMGFVRKQRGREGIKGKRILLTLSPVLFLLSIAGETLMSTDLIRWLDHAYICFFTFVLYVVYREKDSCADYFGSVFRDIPAAPCFLYGLLHFVTVFDPYIDGIGLRFSIEMINQI